MQIRNGVDDVGGARAGAVGAVVRPGTVGAVVRPGTVGAVVRPGTVGAVVRPGTVGAVVLAAGASGRMGRPKALLKLGDETFLRRIAGVIASSGIRDTVIVLGSGADEIRKSLAWFDGIVVENTRWREGQLSSVIRGLDACGPGHDGMMVWPVDHPLVPRTVVEIMLLAFQASPDHIVVPNCHGKRGHPVIWPSCMFNELRSAPCDAGARHVVRKYPDSICEVPTGAEGVLVNIDTPGHYITMTRHRQTASER